MPRIKKFKPTEEEKASLERAGYILCPPVKGELDSSIRDVSEGYIVAKNEDSSFIIFKRNDGYAGRFRNGLWEIPSDYSGLKLTT